MGQNEERLNPANVTSDERSELLERSLELSTLGDWVGEVAGGSRGRLVLVAGEAGVGKTTLLRRLEEERRDGARFLWGACEALFTPRPLGPLLDVAELTGGELAEVLAAESKPHDVVRALVRELRAQAPTVVVLEDLHWADEATLDVMRLLPRRIAGMPALATAARGGVGRPAAGGLVASRSACGRCLRPPRGMPGRRHAHPRARRRG